MMRRHSAPPREDLLRYIRRFCEPETCAAITVGTLQNHIGPNADATNVVRGLWREGLVEPTFAENDPEDGALFGVPHFHIDEQFGPRTQFVLSAQGYAAVDQLIDKRGPGRDDEFEPTPPQLLKVGQAVSRKLIEEFIEHPERLHTLAPRCFEELVAELFSREGYEVELTPVSRDGGRDILAVRSQGFGRELVIAECKRYSQSNPIGVQLVRALYGVLEKEKASRAVLATTSTFTRGARELANELEWRMSLQDYRDMKAWLERLRGVA